jgi:glycerol uptake facilitator-like aquaporin
MSLPFDEALLVPLVLGVVGCNALCLVWLLGMRPSFAAPSPARPPARKGGWPALTPALRACFAEGIGAFALVFVGVLGAAGVGGPAPSPVGAALALGAVAAVLVAALGAVSGGHFNPAVTLGLVAVGRLHPLLGLGYAAAQAAGAVAAAGLLAGLLGPEAVAAGTPGPAETPMPVAVVLETAATFLLVLVYFGTAVDGRGNKALAPLAVGLTVMAGALVLGARTGGALNPVRYLGPALATHDLRAWAVYLTGPCLGGVAAAVLMQFVFFEEAAPEQPAEIDFLEMPPRRTRRSA